MPQDGIFGNGGSRRRPRLPRDGSAKWWHLLLKAWGDDEARYVRRGYRVPSGHKGREQRRLQNKRWEVLR